MGQTRCASSFGSFSFHKSCRARRLEQLAARETECKRAPAKRNFHRWLNACARARALGTPRKGYYSPAHKHTCVGVCDSRMYVHRYRFSTMSTVSASCVCDDENGPATHSSDDVETNPIHKSKDFSNVDSFFGRSDGASAVGSLVAACARTHAPASAR